MGCTSIQRDTSSTTRLCIHQGELSNNRIEERNWEEIYRITLPFCCMFHPILSLWNKTRHNIHYMQAIKGMSWSRYQRLWSITMAFWIPQKIPRLCHQILSWYQTKPSLSVNTISKDSPSRSNWIQRCKLARLPWHWQIHCRGINLLSRRNSTC